MYDNLGAQPGMPRTGQQPNLPVPNPFGDDMYRAGSGLISSGLGAYGEKLLGTSSQYVQSNITKYFSDPQYYFQVNTQYVRNKLRIILLPYLHRGHWTRIAEQVGGRLAYKPPTHDINAPDLYIPCMAFGTYIVLAAFATGLLGKFTAEEVTFRFTKGLVGWFFQVLLLKSTLYFLGTGEGNLLDIVAYGGYAFVGISASVLARIVWKFSYYGVMAWTCISLGVLLVKTLKRMLLAQVRNYGGEASKSHYFLLFVAVAQFPLFIWLAA